MRHDYSTRTNATRARRLAAALLAALAALPFAAVCAGAQTRTPAGTQIANRGHLVYTEPDGGETETYTPTVIVTVESVNGLAVTPDETAPSGEVGASESVTVGFRVCNAGNSPLPFVISGAAVTAPAHVESVHLDDDSSGTVSQGDTPVALGVTRTPGLSPGACSPVLVTFQTGGAEPGAALTATLTAHSPEGVGQQVSDSGTVVRVVKKSPRLRDPDDPNLPPRKSVNGAVEVTAGVGSVVTFEIAFRNSGEGRADAVRVYDELPSGLTYQRGTLKVSVGSVTTALTDERDSDDGEVVGQALEARVAHLEPQEVARITFSAKVDPLPGGTVLINRAQVSADNAPVTPTRDVRVLVAPQGMVFDGGVGNSAPVNAATLRVVSGGERGPLASLASPGYAPNGESANPFRTAADGLYSFRPNTPASDETYYILVQAEGFKPRVIEAKLTPLGEGRFSSTLTARDGQPLCASGGFALTGDAVRADNLAALAANIPVFESGGLEIVKEADRASASIGDVVTYRVEVRNTARTPAIGVTVHDTLPQSFNYVHGSALLALGGSGARPIEPDLAGEDIIFHLPPVPGGGTASLTYRVRIGVNARLGEQFNVAVAYNGDKPSTPARAGVVVRGGIFSTNQFLVGRVFADLNHNGRFDPGDRPVEGARLVTSNGRVALTDANGNYNLPVLADGALVVQLDPSSVPEGFAPRDPRRARAASWSHILATPLQGGAMLELSFALEPAGTASDATGAPSQRGGQGREGQASSLGRRDASPVSSARPEAEPKPRKKRSWASRLFGSFFGTPDDSRESNAKSQKPQTATVAAVVAASPAPALAGAESKEAHATAPQYLTTPVASYTSGVVDPVTGRPVTFTVSAQNPSLVVPPADQKHDAPRVVVASLVTPAVSATPAPAAVASDPNAVAGVAKVEAGGVEFDIAPGYVLFKPALDLPVRVALGWGVRLYLNEALVDDSRIGERRKDQGTQSEQITYVGIGLAAGPNRLRAVTVSPEGVERASRELIVYGRGSAVRYTVEPARAEIASGRRSSTDVVVRAFDEWGHPAQDGEVIMQTTAGAFAGGTTRAAAEQHFDPREHAPSRPPAATEIQKQSQLRLRDGVASVQLVSSESPETAHVTVVGGAASAQAEVRFGVEDAPTMLVGYGSVTFGRAAPSNLLRGVTDESVRGSMAFFYRGFVYKDFLLTLSYDSQRPLQRIDGRDRLFQTDPLENQYSVFGDTSTHFNSAPSNSKVYARLDLGHDYGRSYLLFGDYTPERRDSELAAYTRRLTGALVHFENSHGDYVSFGGAHPDTLFGRDVFPGGVFGFSRLTATLVLPGSESVVLETRDRRNPDLVLHTEQLVRGVDYNLDPDSGQIFFKRTVSAFDADLNLRQIVVTYEYAAQGMGTMIYTARGSKEFRSTGTRLGFSANLQQQGALGNFALGGLDFTQKTPHGGTLHLEYARSTGKVAGSGTYYSGSTDLDRQGNAYLATYDQPFVWRAARLQASYRRAGAGFYNPFGGTVTGGASRAGVALDLQATASARLRLGFTDERNKTENVDNNRQTFSAQWTQRVRENLTATFAFDHRHLDNGGESAGSSIASGATNSNLVTAGFEWKPSDRLTLSAKREQNLTESDPTYPNQTVFSGSYKLNDTSRLFVTQRLASAPINPISDLSGGGFAFSQSRHEFVAGVETKALLDTSLVGGYRVEDGLTGTDGYAILGLSRSWKLNKSLSLDGSFERAFHLTGAQGRGYNTVSSGFTWKPRENFVANTSYQWRNRDGSGQTVAAGFAGKPFERVTALGSFQWSRGSDLTSVGANAVDSFGRGASPVPQAQSGFRQGMYGSFGIAVRPLHTDAFAAFFNYQHRSSEQDEGAGAARVRSGERSNTFSVDTFLQAAPKLTLFSKLALKSADSSSPGVLSAATLTYLLQGRAEYRVAPQWDVAIESRFLSQPSTHSTRVGTASEVGYWATPDVRFGVGYNFNRAAEPGRPVVDGDRRGFYFSITTKFERALDFFGARKKEGK